MTALLRTTWTRLRTNMRDPLIRRNVAFYMGGKLLGLALVLTAVWTFLPTIVHAATGAGSEYRKNSATRQCRSKGSEDAITS